MCAACVRRKTLIQLFFRRERIHNDAYLWLFLEAFKSFLCGNSGVPFGSVLQGAGAGPESGRRRCRRGGNQHRLFIMLGSDFVRPGLLPKANDNIGIGHTFGFLKKDPIGDELTFAYTYEDGGSAFWHSDIGSHTESFGVMKNFGLPKTTRVSGCTWVQIGVSSFTGSARVESHFYDGESLGAVVHFTGHSSVWIQETLNKIIASPW
jgi:hypothetical protein